MELFFGSGMITASPTPKHLTELRQQDKRWKQQFEASRQALVRKLLPPHGTQAEQPLPEELLVWEPDVPLKWGEVSRFAPLTLGGPADLLAMLLAQGPYQRILSRFSFRRPADGRTVEACTSLLCLAAAMDDVEALELLLQMEPLWGTSSAKKRQIADFAAWYRLNQTGARCEEINQVRVLPAAPPDSAASLLQSAPAEPSVKTAPLPQSAPAASGGDAASAQNTLTTRDPLATAIFCGAMHTALRLLPESAGKLSADARRALAQESGDDPLADSVREAVCARYGTSLSEMRRRIAAGDPAARAGGLLTEKTARILAQRERPLNAEQHAQFLREMCARYGLAPGGDWRQIEPLALLDALARQNTGDPDAGASPDANAGPAPNANPAPDANTAPTLTSDANTPPALTPNANPTPALAPAAAQKTLEHLVRRVCELDDDIMLPVLYESIPELFLTPMRIPPEEGRGEMYLDTVCYCALLGSNRCLTKLLTLGANPDGLNCAGRFNRIDFSNGGAPRFLPVTPLTCAVRGKNSRGYELLSLTYGGRTIAQLRGVSPKERPACLPQNASGSGKAVPELRPSLYKKLLCAIRCGCEPIAHALLNIEAGRQLMQNDAPHMQTGINRTISYSEAVHLQTKAIERGCTAELFRALLRVFRIDYPDGSHMVTCAIRYNRFAHFSLLLHRHHINWLPEPLLSELVEEKRIRYLSVLIRRQRGTAGRGADLWLQAEEDPLLRTVWRLTGTPADFACGEMPEQGPVPLPRTLTGRQAAEYASPAQLRRFTAERGALKIPEARRCRARILREVEVFGSIHIPFDQRLRQAASEQAALLDALIESCPPVLEEFSTQHLLMLLCLLPDEAPAALIGRLSGRKRAPLVLQTACDLFTLQSLTAAGGILDRWQQRLGPWFYPAILRDAPPYCPADNSYGGLQSKSGLQKAGAEVSAALHTLLRRCTVCGKAPKDRPSRLADMLLHFGTPKLILEQFRPGGFLPGEDPQLLLEYCRRSYTEIPPKNRAALASGLKNKETYTL